MTTLMMNRRGPAYIRLERGTKPEKLKLPKYSHTRKLMNGAKVTVVSMGSVTLNALESLEKIGGNIADLFVVSEIPMLEVTQELEKSLQKTGKLLVLEEHVSRGGLGENLSILLLKNSVLPTSFSHFFANGYPEGLYGDQNYHRKINGLDSESIASTIKKMANE
jgi:transketolase